jgi:hypothetical protein
MITSSNSLFRERDAPSCSRRSTSRHAGYRAVPRTNRTPTTVNTHNHSATSSTTEPPACAPSLPWQCFCGDASPGACSEVGAWLRKVVLGYYQYHAVPGNTTQLRIFKRRVCRLWQSVLVRRSQRAKMCWERFTPVLNRWIPPPRVLHPYPDACFYATHPS